MAYSLTPLVPSSSACLDYIHNNVVEPVYLCAERAMSACPQSLRQIPRQSAEVFKRVRDALPQDPFGRAALTTLGASLAYQGANYLAPAVVTLSAPLPFLGASALFVFEVLRQHDALLAHGCVVGALVALGLVTLLPVVSAAYLALAVTVGAGLGAAAVICAGPKLGGVLPAQQTAPATAAPAPSPDPVVPPAISPQPPEYSEQAPCVAGPSGVCSTEARWFNRVREQAQQLSGPYAKQYRAKILDTLRALENPSTTDTREEHLERLTKLEALAKTLTPIRMTEAEQVTRFQELKACLSDHLVGNPDVKESILNAASLQWQQEASDEAGSCAASFVFVTGERGCGKNQTAIAVGTHYGAKYEINMSTVDARSFQGFSTTYKQSACSPITQMLLENPDQYCFLYLDEMGKASIEQQKLLLGLLSPTNEFVDAHLNLPINKSRLFILCSAVNDPGEIDGMLRDLHSRIKNYEVKMRSLEGPERVELFERQLAMHMRRANLMQGRDVCITTMASEIMASASDEGEGRELSDCALKQVQKMVALRNLGVLPQRLDGRFIRQQNAKMVAHLERIHIKPHQRAERDGFEDIVASVYKFWVFKDPKAQSSSPILSYTQSEYPFSGTRITKNVSVALSQDKLTFSESCPDFDGSIVFRRTLELDDGTFDYRHDAESKRLFRDDIGTWDTSATRPTVVPQRRGEKITQDKNWSPNLAKTSNDLVVNLTDNDWLSLIKVRSKDESLVTFRVTSVMSLKVADRPHLNSVPSGAKARAKAAEQMLTMQQFLNDGA